MKINLELLNMKKKNSNKKGNAQDTRLQRI